VGAKTMNISQNSTFISAIIPSFCLHSHLERFLIAHGRAFPKLSGLMGIVSHRLSSAKESSRGFVPQANMHCITMRLVKKRYHALIGDAGG